MKYIFGNWKLHPKTAALARELGQKIKKSKKYEVAVFPPFPFLSIVKYPNLGAQDSFWEKEGPFTGQVSPFQLKSLKVKYALVGHSELRTLQETNDMIALKTAALLSAKITPVVCVGFGTQFGDSDEKVLEIVKLQLASVAPVAEMKKIIVAYEPVWAISSGNPHATKHVATPEHAAFVANEIKRLYRVKAVIYGGSTTKDNSQSFLEHPKIDGLLVGGASIVPREFNKIIGIKL
ncbi:MAG TPA: triose-phosphate isomerase family protein [Patescibacteria group bacterium]|nr:triose-phosphate isomerase family protein [Patescibacteria group bacterium]